MQHVAFRLFDTVVQPVVYGLIKQCILLVDRCPNKTQNLFRYMSILCIITCAQLLQTQQRESHLSSVHLLPKNVPYMSETSSPASKNKLRSQNEQTCCSYRCELNCAMQISFLTITDDPHLHAWQQRFNIGGQGVLRPQALLVKWPINHKPC